MQTSVTDASVALPVSMSFINIDSNAYPDIVEGVGRMSRVINKAFPTIISFRKRDAKFWVNVFHKMPAIMHRLKDKSEISIRHNMDKIYVKLCF